MENAGFFFDSDNIRRKERNYLTVFILLTIVLTITCVILGWQLLEFRKIAKLESSEKVEALSAKENLLYKLKNIELEYDDLSMEYEGLDSVFTKEKTQIKTLMSEIKNLKGSTENYKAQVTELEKRLKEYLAKIDDMKLKNETLTSENIKYKNTLDSVLNKSIVASSKEQTVTDKLKSQVVLKAVEIVSEGIRFNTSKQEVATRTAKKAQRIKSCFSLTENNIAIKGYKVIYIRIADPTGTILFLSDNDSFIFKGKNIVYSAKKEIYYDTKVQDVCIYWDKIKELKPGTYYIDIFADDNLLGTSILVLE